MSNDGMMAGPEQGTRADGALTQTQLISGIKEAIKQCLAPSSSYREVDTHFFKVLVRDPIDPNVARTLADHLGALCTDEFLARGPSFIDLGAKLDSQDLALTVMAVGEVAGFWKLITPEQLGIMGEQANKMAGRGFVMTDGFKRPSSAGLDDLTGPKAY
jgi:hypothetical protein